jgi:hypothetical protein
LSPVQLPNLQTTQKGSEPCIDIFSYEQIADMLRNSLQIAKQAVRGAGGYKTSRSATASVYQITTTTSRSLFNSIPTSTASFSTSSKMASTKSFLQTIKERRTIYALNKEAPISDKEIQDIVNEVVLHVPSSFNSQSARLVVLLNKEHETFWDFTLEVLKTMVPAEQLPSTEQKLSGFRAGYGTVSTTHWWDRWRCLHCDGCPTGIHHYAILQILSLTIRFQLSY